MTRDLREPRAHQGYSTIERDPYMHVGTFARGQAYGNNGMTLVWISGMPIGSFADGQATTRNPRT